MNQNENKEESLIILQLLSVERADMEFEILCNRAKQEMSNIINRALLVGMVATSNRKMKKKKEEEI